MLATANLTPTLTPAQLESHLTGSFAEFRCALLRRFRAMERAHFFGSPDFDFNDWTTSDVAEVLGFALDALGTDDAARVAWATLPADVRDGWCADAAEAVTMFVDELADRHESVECGACGGAGGSRDPRGGSRSGTACAWCEGEGWLGR